ncbi:MAG: glycosyltransferase family protein [Planctomycetota bacterium]|jgi:glycosyltransferase involved in cell wall biosynthesis
MGINARAEKLLGVNAKSLVYSTYYITSDFDYNLSQLYSIPILGKLVPFIVFLWACLFADRLHFYCDRGLIPTIKPYRFNFSELYIYRLLGIPVFFWTYGADVRSRETTKMLGEPNCCTECTLAGRACFCNERRRIKKIGALRKHSVKVFSMGDMIEYTPGSHNNLFFWPVDLNGGNAHKYEPAYPKKDGEKPLRIVHASNHRMFKGTHFLIEAVENLKTEGVSIELILVEKVPNEKALDIYRSADIIFDQCLIGFHGYFALEGMAMGKPAMCFVRKPEEYLLHPEECPIINTSVNTLRKDIQHFIDNREQLTDIGIKSRQYIEKYFTLEAFAGRLKEAYEELGVLK